MPHISGTREWFHAFSLLIPVFLALLDRPRIAGFVGVLPGFFLESWALGGMFWYRFPFRESRLIHS